VGREARKRGESYCFRMISECLRSLLAYVPINERGYHAVMVEMLAYAEERYVDSGGRVDECQQELF
jgi:hypothetical protein